MKLSTTYKNLWIITLTIILTVLLSNVVYSRYLNKEGFFGAIGRFFDQIGRFFQQIPKVFTSIGGIFGKIIGIFLKIGKIFAFLGMIGTFFCWLGDAVQWFIDTVAAIIYYVGNVFGGCILSYLFDIFIGTMYYILYMFASFIGWSEYYKDGISQLNELRLTADAYVYEIADVNVFKYSKFWNNKCYKLKFRPFPRWPFNPKQFDI